MNQRIIQALTNLFERHRVVFWYDAKQELRDDFESLALDGVEKIEVLNNEYGLKYKILRERPEDKFLLYREGAQPEDIDNWLLDLQLANGEFRTDQASIWLSELELGLEFSELVLAHAEFFHASKRKDQLKRLLTSDDTAGAIRLKMLSVCAGSDARMDAIVEYLLEELAAGTDEKYKLIVRSKLDDFFWQQMQRLYGYTSESASLKDFTIELFKSCFAMLIGTHSTLSNEALVFLKRWKDSRQHERSFEMLSEDCAEILSIEQELATRDFRLLLDVDYFRLIDQKIISELVVGVSNRTVAKNDVSQWVRQRRQGHWYNQFSHLYEALDYAAQFIYGLNEANLEISSFSEAVDRYSKHWYLLDQLYRKFTYHVRMSAQSSLMATLSEQIENLYSNQFLLKLGDRFQEFIPQNLPWGSDKSLFNQHHFFDQWVTPYLKKDNKVCVIISDAMRYEVGQEFMCRIRQEDRYSAELSPMISMLPSFTQLGMAALLPNKSLAIAEDDSGTVFIEDQSTQGTQNRTKILQSSLNGRGVAVKAEEFMQLSRDDSREMLKANDVVYFYHNRIDHTGDKMHSEGLAFEAVEHTLEDLMKLVKKLTANNVSNILITADHGFIYQNKVLDESDFSSEIVQGDEVLYRDRRFVLGKGLHEQNSVHKFSSTQLGLVGTLEILIPKSINRLRLKGSGSRFVHGGASLQEIVIPVLKINKKRTSDISAVTVEILRGSSSVITSGQLAVTLYQSDVVTDKMQPRKLRAGIYTISNELISDEHELYFDIPSENPRDREFQVRFVLSRRADEFNGQEVILRLDERHAGTTHFKEYKSIRYLLRRSFTSDFDF